MTHTIILPFAFLFGCLIGSFANVLIYRIPRGLDFVRGTSVCISCGNRIMPYDLIPMLSYLFLGGKCRRCKAPISIRYPIIELLAGGLAVLAVWTYGCSPAAFACFLICMNLVVISFIDAEHMLIPNGLVISLAVLSIVFAALNRDTVSLLDRAGGFFILSVPMLALCYVIHNAFGGGDIKLIAVCGFLLGWRMILLAGFVAVLLGGCHGVIVKYVMRNEKATHIAFGQYICIGVFIAMLYGERLLSLYLGLYGFGV